MSKRLSWIWDFYFTVYTVLIPVPTIYFFARDTPVARFYQILTAFDPAFLLPYLMNALAVMLAMLSVVPFYLFITRTVWLSAGFWRLMCGARLTADLAGRSYEILFIKSVAAQNPRVAAAMAGLWLMFYIPSYMASFYAFDGRSSGAPDHP